MTDTPTNSIHASKNPIPEYGFGKIILWTLLFQLAWSWGSLKKIITDGTMPGPDDFMRLIQVRGLMAGQGWFDTTAYRMLPPQGAEIHWSRLIDAPIAGLIYALGPIFGHQLAERITIIIWPTVLIVLTVLVLTKICDSLFTRYNRLLPVFFTVLCVSSLAQFVPGRIDHHNVQILLYVSLLWCLVNWRRPSAILFAAIIIPLSISIGLDVIAFAILFMAWIGVEWVLGFDKAGKALGQFAVGMAAATLVLYAVNVAPENWFAAYCDANSLVYLTAQLSIAASLLIMALSSKFLQQGSSAIRITSRLALAGALAVACLALLLTLFPECIGGPYAAVSDELNARWLSRVSEAKDLFTVLATSPEHWVKTVAYCALIVATGFWLLSQKIDNKQKIALLLATFIISLLMAVIQFRTIRIGFFAAIPICVLATELLTRKLISKYGQGSLPSMVGQIGIVIILSTASWALIGGVFLGKSTPKPTANIEQVDKNLLRKTCFQQSDYTLLKSLPAGHVMSSLNSAAPILVFTDKTVVSGPYHRNQNAILDVLDFYSTNLQSAKDIADKHKLDYVTYCRYVSRKKKAASKIDSIKYAIEKNKLPGWLEKISGEDDKLLIFRVVK